MRFRKAISGLNASPSQIKRKLKHMKPPGYNMDVDEMLVLATMKMSPIIDVLMEAPKSPVHFIRVSECDDIEQVMNIVRDVTKALENIGFEMDIQMVNLNMEKYRKRANCDRQVYVDTSLLLGILELHHILENVKEDLDCFYRSIGIHSFVQTESGLTSISSGSSAYNPNKIVFKLNATKGSSSLDFLKKDFLVMPSMTQIVPLVESKSQILIGSAPNDYSSLKKSKSEVFIDDEEITGVTDVYGARKILVKCIYDLKGVSDYLAIPRMDASTIVSNASEDSGRFYGSSQPDEEGKATLETKRHSLRSPIATGSRRCCCKDCFADFQGADARFPECDEDQVIICIKGCNEDEGDVQIVIRQCPECRAHSEARNDSPPSSDKTFKAPPDPDKTFKAPLDPGRNSKVPSDPEPGSPLQLSIDDALAAIQSPEKVESIYNLEPLVLHNKDSKGSVVCSDEEEEQSAKKPTNYVQNHLSCSRIRLCETTNLCLETGTGQELVISLTVTPKELVGEKLSLADIFSDSEGGASEPADLLHEKPASKTATRAARQRVAYFVPERYIPLGRTKICSSLDFDVTTASSRIRSHGMRNRNNKIVVQLQDFGTDNLLRACRPAKCCRKAILDEKMKKCLPYAASLRSLPLDDDDLSTINESLQMSLQKVKNSTDLKKDFQANVLRPMHTVLYFFVEQPKKLCPKRLTELKLAFYINLVSDVPRQCHYNILYFGVESKMGKNQANHSMKTRPAANLSQLVDPKISKTLPKWVSSYEERPISPLKVRNSCLSRIPVYRKPKKIEYLEAQEFQDEELHAEPDIYEASLRSLPRAALEDDLSLLRKLRANVDDGLSKSRFSSKCSIGGTRGKRKKKEFYLSKSRSELSLNVLRQRDSKSNKLQPLSEPTIARKVGEQKQMGLEEHPSKIILNYFSKMLYEMVKKQMELEQLKMHVGVETENKSVLEIYRKPLKIVRKSFNPKLSYHDLQAKQSECCMLMANTISLQTSRLLSDCKKCQTSSSLLAYMINRHHCEKKRILKKCFNCEQSCDEIENFLVNFNSDQSSEFSDGVFMPSGSESNQEDDSLRLSLMQLKETLEQYECIKMEIAKQPQHSLINPIEYFVYHQVCACNGKVAKKPSMLQKIVSKTKELFCSPEKDMSRKYNNQRAFSMNLAGDEQCRKCGCKISNCHSESAHPLQQLLCSCPEGSGAKQPRPSFIACCKKSATKPKRSFSKLSLQSLGSRLKNSISRSKQTALKPCQCVADQDTEKISMCVSSDVELVKCQRVSAGTSTMRDSSTQKCSCGKCEHFADDGTCCCSHCLGCLDKSFDAKPANQSVAVETDHASTVENLASVNSAAQDHAASPQQSKTVSSGSQLEDPGTIILEAGQSRKSLERSSVVDPQFASESQEVNNFPSMQSGTLEEAVEQEQADLQTGGSDGASATYFFVAPPPRLFQQLLNFQQMFQMGAQEGLL